MWSRSGTSEAESADPASRAKAPDKAGLSGPAAGTERPALKRPSPPAERAGDRKSQRPYREYVNERGVLVRDYRSGDHPEYNPSFTKKPRKQEVEQRIVEGVRESVYESVRECRNSVAPEAFGDEPRAQAEILFDIEDGELTAGKALIKMSDVEKKAGTEFATCIQEQAKQMSFAAAGHKKVSQYRITLIFPLR